MIQNQENLFAILITKNYDFINFFFTDLRFKQDGETLVYSDEGKLDELKHETSRSPAKNKRIVQFIHKQLELYSI